MCKNLQFIIVSLSLQKKVSLARHSFFTTLSQLFIQFFGILSGIIMARMLGPEGRGVYALYYTNAQLIFTFASLSFNTALVYFIPAGKFPAEKILGLAFVINIFSSLASILIIGIAYFTPMQNLLFSGNYMGWAFLLWLMAYTVAMIFANTYTAFFQATRNFPDLNRNNLMVSLSSLLCFILLFFCKDVVGGKVIYFLVVLLLAQLLGIFLFARSLRMKMKVRPTFKFSLKNDFKGLRSFILAAHLSIVVNFFNYKFSTWVINFYINEAALGWYSLAINLGGMFSLITEPLAMVLTPYLSEKKGDEKKKMFYSYFRLFFWVMLLAGVAAFFVAPYLIPWIYGVDFEPSVQLFQLAIPGIVLAALTRILATFNFSSGKQEYNLYSTLVGFAFTIVANFALVTVFYEKGAVMANLITYTGIFLTLLLLSSIKLRLNPARLFLLSLSDLLMLKNGFKRIVKR